MSKPLPSPERIIGALHLKPMTVVELAETLCQPRNNVDQAARRLAREGWIAQAGIAEEKRDGRKAFLWKPAARKAVRWEDRERIFW